MSAADTYIVSDVHLGNRHCQRAMFMQFLDALPEGVRLVLNGDIIDDPDEPLTAEDEAILQRLVAESQRRSVVWVHGNHDEGFQLENAGQIEYVERWSLDGRILALHGDELDGVMPRHGLFKKAFKALHRLRVRLGFPDVHVSDYAKRWGFLYRVLTDHVASKALKAARAEGFDVVTCGHTHAAVDRISNGSRYLNTGCWTESPAWVVIVADEAIHFRRFPSADGGAFDAGLHESADAVTGVAASAGS